MPNPPPERPKQCLAGGEPRGPAQRGATGWFNHRGPCGPPASDETLIVGAPRVGRCLLVASGRLHPDLGAKMENAPNPTQAASRRQLGQFQPHRALRGGRLVALTGSTRVATSRSLAREWWAIRATRRYLKNYDTTVYTLCPRTRSL
jgi:hypothetical protein